MFNLIFKFLSKKMKAEYSIYFSNIFGLLIKGNPFVY